MTLLYRAQDDEVQSAVSKAVEHAVKNHGVGNWGVHVAGAFRHGAREWVIREGEQGEESKEVSVSVIMTDGEAAFWEIRGIWRRPGQAAEIKVLNEGEDDVVRSPDRFDPIIVDALRKMEA
ncbi:MULTISPECIES: hypothetical protein [Streptomyces]|uniref:Uncharacterized protein n=2 Tax=Streptomyces avermitilis TaxID=33903 RepID=A0A146FBX6_STRAW|nr:hypothetical protein [Streptomyces avermitilis]BAU68545.1 hypothetical protein SAVERM_1p98 [Streptomyces avermitilis MA-4680 = NBRC 14893]BBJ56451.1 hypothetical protein SAVMC3_90800 [Streptomyces avermitilis]GDY70477.1 hypothetical protein SAV14893_098700 [Streptomyces avermitilis]GDY80792.1 hypothetical protein SAV31267_102770 [Streptomyces avermitilis]